LEASIKVAKEGEKRAVGERDIGAGAKLRIGAWGGR